MRNSTSADSSNTNLAYGLVGWTPESGGRGTWSIITSSLFTIFICTWTAIHPRIHTEHRLHVLHKLAQLVKTILAPEMVCLESLQEWIQARKMVKRSANATEHGLKLVHAFYIGMLGIRYQTEHGHKVLWPSQYAWLLNNGLTRWSERDTWGLSEDSIRDKNKADGLVKLAAICQVTWFVLQCITRTAHQLPIAPLEAMTLAYVLVVFLTYIFWWLKPKDIATASFVKLPDMTEEQWRVFQSLAMENAYDREDTDVKPSRNLAWYLVSRDCKGIDVLVTRTHLTDDTERSSMVRIDTPETMDEAERSGSSRGTDSDEESTNLATAVAEDHKQSAEQDEHVITEWDEALYFSRFWPLICVLGAAFGAFHLVSWNTAFPTITERWLWRTSALLSVATSIVCMQFRKMSLRWDGPLTVVRVGSPVLYLISRIAMIVEVFAAMRAMPAATYQTYVVVNYWFHVL